MPRRLVLAPHLAYLLDLQDQVLPVAQAYDCGYTRSSIHHALSARRWQRLLPGVLLLHGQPPTRRQLVHAAALRAESGAAIDADSACVWHRIPLAQFEEGWFTWSCRTVLAHDLAILSSCAEAASSSRVVEARWRRTSTLLPRRS